MLTQHYTTGYMIRYPLPACWIYERDPLISLDPSLRRTAAKNQRPLLAALLRQRSRRDRFQFVFLVLSGIKFAVQLISEPGGI